MPLARSRPRSASLFGEQELEARIQQLEARLAKKAQVIAEVAGAGPDKKRAWGSLTGRWVPHDVRDVVIDFVREWSDKTEVPQERFIRWLEMPRGKFFEWRERYGKANEHNSKLPRDFWLLRRSARPSSTFTSATRSEDTGAWRS